MPVCKHCQRSSLSKIGTNFNFKYLKRIIHMHPLAFHNTCICMSLLPLICSNHDLLLYCTPTLSHLLKSLAYCLYLTNFSIYVCPQILLIFCSLPEIVSWVVFSVIRWHPLTELQFSTVHSGVHQPPHL